MTAVAPYNRTTGQSSGQWMTLGQHGTDVVSVDEQLIWRTVMVREVNANRKNQNTTVTG